MRILTFEMTALKSNSLPSGMLAGISYLLSIVSISMFISVESTIPLILSSSEFIFTVLSSTTSAREVTCCLLN